MTTMSEITTAGYARQQVTWTAPAGVPMVTSNNALLFYGPFTADMVDAASFAALVTTVVRHDRPSHLRVAHRRPAPGRDQRIVADRRRRPHPERLIGVAAWLLSKTCERGCAASWATGSSLSATPSGAQGTSFSTN
jgi:hypothetical protein